MTRRLLSLATVGLVASLAACGGSATTVAPTATAAPTADVTPTPAVTPATAEEQPSSDAGPFPAGEPVDLVLISDSTGYGVATRYAALASEALDREVRVHDHVIGGAPITKLRDMVQGSWAGEVAEAEIIVLYGNPEGLEPDLLPNIFTCIEAGLEPTQEWLPPVVPSAEDWQSYRDVLDEIYDEIWTLREARPTILRAYDSWNPFIAPWREAGVEPECTANWEVQMQVVREAAEANGAVLVSLFGVFNGPGHDEDPRVKGWISDDGVHASDEGQSAIADALTAVGFEVSEPPR